MVERPAILPPVAFLGVAAISLAAPLIKLCPEAPPAVIAAARLGIASIVVVTLAAILRGPALVHQIRSHARPLLMAGLFLAAHFYCWIVSLKHTSVLSSVVIVTTNPIFVGIASRIIFAEPIRRGLAMGIGLSSLGGLLIVLSDSSQEHGTLYGDLMALLAAIMASCYLLVGRRVRRDTDLLSYITPVYTIAAILLLVTALALGQPFTGHTPRTYGFFLMLAIGPQLLGHSALNWCLRHVSATLVAVFILGEPIGAALLAFFFLGEEFESLQLFGGALILLGILAASLLPAGRAERDPTDTVT